MLNGEVNQTKRGKTQCPSSSLKDLNALSCFILYTKVFKSLTHQKKIYGLTFTEGLKINPHTCELESSVYV